VKFSESIIIAILSLSWTKIDKFDETYNKVSGNFSCDSIFLLNESFKIGKCGRNSIFHDSCNPFM